ncbi:IS110 family transposase [Methylobacterium thuringiense]|uniref:IS110 family transposase ISMex9 n=1 Tax=Methylobacterium thuringiense TaxID=1003091 RepID=A0ABQ4TJ29_9HYPH|nr:IS110 family transposase [Methylobacterium thuringiense]GJE54527.1 IS110 family transposase ISMex9 [Methylobacterium thuringiense]
MKHYVGLDVALKTTQICVMDQEQKIVAEAKIETHPEALSQYLFKLGLNYQRVGLETGNLAQWLYTGMAEAGLPIICVDARKIKSFLKLQKVNKNDRNDARGIAKAMHIGTEHAVHMKTIESQRMRSLLAARKSIQIKMNDLKMFVRGNIRQYGMKMDKVSLSMWEARVRELIAGDNFLCMVVEPILVCIRTMRQQVVVLSKEINQITRGDPTCRLLMTCPGVGPVVSLTFKTSIDIPERFANSQTVGAYLGLTPKQNQSGETDKRGRISRAGDIAMRTALVEAAHSMLSRGRACWLKEWALKIKKRTNLFVAAIALARRLAVILHRMWVDKTEFCWEAAPKRAVAA